MRFWGTLVLSATLLFLSAAAQAASLNTVRGFVYTWFGAFDENRPVEEFLAHLEPQVEMHFPDRAVHSTRDFASWYANVLRTYAHATHELTDLAVWREGDHYRVEINLHWHATKRAGGDDDLLVHQRWEVIDSAQGLHIRRYDVQPLAKP
jgi:hypothetical protein